MNDQDQRILDTRREDGGIHFEVTTAPRVFQPVSITLTANSPDDVWAIRHLLVGGSQMGLTPEKETFRAAYDVWTDMMRRRSVAEKDERLDPDTVKLASNHPWVKPRKAAK